MSDKNQQRQLIRQRLMAMSENQYHTACRAAILRLADLLSKLNYKDICTYSAQAQWYEISLEPLLKQINASLPELTITWLEPSQNPPLPSGKYDVILVPLLAYDDRGYRLGRGSGWYDRLLASQPGAYTIGVGFDCQRLPRIITEPHDMPLDAIVTQSDNLIINTPKPRA